MRERSAPARIGVVIYEGVEPIDLGGTIGVISMARRILPNLEDAVIASEAGPVRLAGGLVVQAPYDTRDAPVCDVTIVCGGSGWPKAAADCALITYLQSRPLECLASVCTGALILAEAGCLDRRAATTRRARAGSETQAPLELLAQRADAREALVVDDIVVTGGGVSLAIDTTLYLLGRLYGEAARDDVARMIEYDRSFAANRATLEIITPIRSSI